MTELTLSAVVRLAARGDAGIIVIDNPPINAGSQAVRQGLLAAIGAVDRDPAFAGGVLIGAGAMFMAGADIREFGAPLRDPQFPEVIAAIEASAKPFVAAIAGAALGGGYELALGCDDRVTAADAVVGLPETSLGTIPGAGGTQRLPRLVGLVRALELIAAGSRVKAPEALRLGMIDAIATGDLLEEAIARLRSLGDRKQRIADRAVPAVDESAFAAAKAAVLKAGKGRPHIRAAVAAVEASLTLTFAEALVAERAAFQALRVSREAAALRHLFFAERKLGKTADIAGAVPRDLRSLAVIGGGTMGVGIACTLLDGGRSVTLVEQDDAAAQKALERLRALLETRVSRGRMRETEARAALARFAVTTALDSVSGVDAIIEAVYEDIAVKCALFERLGRLDGGSLLFTNTSYLPVTRIAEASGRAADVAGLHFFSPAEVMRLVEVIRHDAVSPVTLASAIGLARALGKLPVLANDAYGFIGNRIYSAYRRQCEFLLEEGALPETLDQALEEFGFAMGPCAVADLTGLDIAWRIRQAQAATRDPALRYVRIADRLCELGRLGRKTGAGYYRYDAAGRRSVDPEVSALIARASAEAGIIRRAIAAEEIVERALAAMASEAALLITEGVAAAATDVDLVLTSGYGFPRHEGGILFWARQQPESGLEAAFARLAQASSPGFRLGPIAALRSD